MRSLSTPESSSVPPKRLSFRWKRLTALFQAEKPTRIVIVKVLLTLLLYIYIYTTKAKRRTAWNTTSSIEPILSVLFELRKGEEEALAAR